MQDWIGGTPTSSKIRVNSESALTYMAVYACVRVLSESEAMLPLQVYKRTGNGGKEIAKNHPLNRLLHTEPNRQTTSYKLRETAMKSLCLDGNAYVLPYRSARGVVGELQLFLPDEVCVYEWKRDLFYEIDGKHYNQDEIVHIKGMGDSRMGLSPIGYHREVIANGMASNQYEGKFYSNGSHVPGYLGTDQKLDDKQRERLRKTWNGRHSGVDGAFSTAVLEGGVKYNSISIPQKDAQFLETRKFNKNEIASMYRVPPHLIADLERSTNNNIEHQSLEFVKYSLMPWLVNIESQFNKDLFTRFEKDEYFVEHNLNGILRGDIQARTEHYTKMFNIGYYTHNQIAALENHNGYEGGDRRYIQGAMVPLDQLDNMINGRNQNNNPGDGNQNDSDASGNQEG